MKRGRRETRDSTVPMSDADESRFQFATPNVPPCLEREKHREPRSSQQKADHDVYGLSTESEIGMDVVAKLEECIAQLEHKPAWDMAMELNPEYPRSLMLPFLRSVEGSAKRACKRITRHFETKLEFFGPEKLVQPIEITDLDDNDMEALRSGGFQVLPAKDRAGRPMLFGRYTALRYREIKNMIKALFYIWSTMVEEEAHQRSGVVAIGFENGKLPLQRFDSVADDGLFDMFSNFDDGGFDRDLARGILAIPLSVPVRPMGLHICADSNQWEGIFDMVVSTICKFVRLRIRFHYGTMQENKYAMMTHGIPVETIPVTPEGEVDLTNHLLWIEHRKQIEAARRAAGHYIPSTWGS